MKKKEQDKRLIIPSDAFEEEASEGLGRLTREEAAEDLHDLEKRLERRYRKPLNIWIPAAAAVILILISSGLYVGLFRNQPRQMADYAELWAVIHDTALIALAEPVIREEIYSGVSSEVLQPNISAPAETHDKIALPEGAASAREKEASVAEDTGMNEVVIESMPRMAKADVQEKKAPAGSQAAAYVLNHPLPEGGAEAFEEYIKNNLRYPEDVIPRVSAAVTLSFTVAVDSTLKNIRAKAVAGKSFTDEAIRLVKEGPKWIPVISNGIVVEDTVHITINFK